MTVGYPGLAAMAAPLARKEERIQIVFLQSGVDSLGPDNLKSFARSAS